MPPIYELALLGSPSVNQVSSLEKVISKTLEMFNLRLGREVGWAVCPDEFKPNQQRSSAAAFFGGENPPIANIEELLQLGIPILPITSDPSRVSAEIPSMLQGINCLSYTDGGAQRVATALLECVGLLPRQRRVFLSYRRGEAREAALQLFDELSARQFDVFLDTHGIPPAEDFQTMLWHRLCDSDVLLMLDTPNYFESRWTSAEFGRALAKGISVLQVSWPNCTPSARTATASRAQLQGNEVNPNTGLLSECAVERICLQLEEVRSKSHAVRSINLASNLRNAIETIGGQHIGIGPNKAIHFQLPDGRDVVVYPTVGVPTSTTLHDATINSAKQSVAVVYDHIGLHPQWQLHLDWLGQYIDSARWVKASEAGWDFAAWPYQGA